MKTDTSLWPQMLLSKGATQLLKVVSGNAAVLDTGTVMKATVQQAEANTLKIMLKGETFIVRGLPPSMVGKEINILAQHSGSRLELVWLAAPATGKTIPTANQQSTSETEGFTSSHTGEKITISSKQPGSNVVAGSHMPGKLKLQIIAGNSAKITIGDSYETTARKAGFETFRISIKGETFVIKGLPDAVAGEKITVTAKQSNTLAKSTIEFEWSASDKQQKLLSTGKEAITQKTTLTRIISNIPDSLINAGKLSGQVRSIEGTRMTLQLAPDTVNTASRAVQTMIADRIPGIQNGQNITARIHTGGNKKPVLEIQLQAKHLEAQSTIQQLKLSAGEITIALVQKRLPNGNIQFNVRGTSFESPAPPSIKHGDALMLRMTKSGELEVMQAHKDIGEKALSVLRNKLPASSPAAQSISAIRTLQPAMAASEWTEIESLARLETWLNSASNEKESINGQRLAALIRDSGQNLESKLMAVLQQSKPDLPLQQDLKAILLQIAELQADKTQNTALARTLSEIAQQGASRIEAGQALNVLANIQSEPYRFEFPMLINQQVTNVQLAIQQNNHGDQQDTDNDNSADRSYNVLFSLELSQLGKLRIDANISDSSVYARIYNDNSEIQQFIQQHIQRLESRLHDMGYREVYFNVSTAQPDAEKQARFEQLATMTPATFSLLDIRI